MIGVVVGLSTTMSVVALALLAASSGPFDHAYARQSGAHVVAAFDVDKVSTAQLTATAQRADAVAGPFGTAVLDLTGPDSPPGSLTVVGRADPGGPVDRLNLWKGRWPTRPGEIVLSQNPVSSGGDLGPFKLGSTETVASGPTATRGPSVAAAGRTVVSGPKLTVVGFAFSVSDSANAWVTPEQIAALHPTSNQMLYRFRHAATSAQVSSGLAAVTTGLPAGALVASQSYLTLRAIAASEPGTFVPFLIVFGCLGLAVAVLIVANVVSGAVVAGFRHIGVLKALGFTPGQVMAVYLTMVSIPAIAGCLLGVVLGNLLATPLLNDAFREFGTGDVGVASWVDVVAVVGMPVVVALSALVPSLRARGVSATEAISAGSAAHTGRGLWIQRRLSATRLPRSVSLGLGLPFARLARSVLTMAAVVLGVASVTFAIGLGRSVTRYEAADHSSGASQVTVLAPPPGEQPPGVRDSTLSLAQVESLLHSTPGTAQVIGNVTLPVRAVGSTQDFQVRFFREDSSSLNYRLLKGHWLDGPGQVAVSERFLKQSGHAVGDTLVLEGSGHRVRVRIVGQVLNSSKLVLSNWQTLDSFAPGTPPDGYEVQLTPGTDANAYMSRVQAADPSLFVASGDDGTDAFIVILYATITLLTLMLATVAALGVFNTVVLNTRERRRDLGMLRSIGMTPRQVTVMMVTSMAALGVVGGLLGLPIGIVAHRLVLPPMMRSAQVALPDFVLHVYPAPLLVLLALAGIAIAGLGALLPARSAARITIAKVLHSE